MGRYRAGLDAIRARNALDERALQSLTAAFTAPQAQHELEGLRQLGGVEAIRPDAATPSVPGVELLDATRPAPRARRR
ncbi:hypothetical protein [Iamia sp.]|uniref:hypothetical protein n=1 Tax=Iamia sp. TaxID=2722710 RepID=UPI002CACF711|nr:hypothetical protein [Iamia sp.]HXH56332.1 hypothetical protein [Iamia sp.]